MVTIPPVRRRRSRPSLGIALILIGLLFFGKELGIIYFSWPLILILVGLSLLVEAILKKKSSSVFPGTLLFLLGLIFWADDIYWLHGSVSSNWPLILIALGISFSASYLAEPSSNRGALVPGGILIAIGGLFLLTEYRVFRLHHIFYYLNWWPILLILVGTWLLVRKRN